MEDKKKNKMPPFFLMNIIVTITGFMMTLIGAIINIFEITLILIFLGGFIMLYSNMIPMTIIFKKKLQPFFFKLKENEEYNLHIDRRGKIFPIIMETKHEGVQYKKDYGWIEEKGAALEWGDMPMNISLQNIGITLDPKIILYQNRQKQKGIDSYEEAVRAALGEEMYKNFCKNFRNKAMPDIFDVQKEYTWLLKTKLEKNLNEKIAGENMDFKDLIGWYQNADNPYALETAIEREKLIAKQEAMMNMKAKAAIGYAVAIVIVIIGVIVAFYALTSLDLSAIIPKFGP